MDFFNSDEFTRLWEQFREKVLDIDIWLHFIWIGIQIIIIYIAAKLVVRFSWKIIDKLLTNETKSPFKVDKRRTKTLGILVHNILKYTIYFFAILMVLGKLNFDLGPLLAGAGVVGLAIGFGAQNLVKDIITGFFIVFEDQFAVGDYISVGNYTGTVEELGLRATKIRKWTGELHILPNGNITEVTNYSTHNSIAVIDVGVAYEENVSNVIANLEEIFNNLNGEVPDLVNKPEILGVQSLGASEVVIRITAESLPMKHFAVGRKLREIIKTGFDEANIEIPYPRLVMYKRMEKGELLTDGEETI